MKNSLKKKSGAPTVSLEVILPADGVVAAIDAGEVLGAMRRTVELTQDERLAKLSEAIRGGREGQLAAAIFTPDLHALQILAKEQATAKGDFPGPCPVVYNGPAVHAEAAIAAGAAGCVLTPSDLPTGAAVAASDAEVLWRVESTEDIEQIVAYETAPEDSFLLCGTEVASLVTSLPAGAAAVAAVTAMQADDGEIVLGREHISSGCKAVLVQGACVGDVEDLDYSRYAIKELTTKKSSAFAIDGHTGSTNGHFGGVRSKSRRPEDGWLRVQSAAKSAVPVPA